MLSIIYLKTQVYVLNLLEKIVTDVDKMKCTLAVLQCLRLDAEKKFLIKIAFVIIVTLSPSISLDASFQVRGILLYVLSCHGLIPASN